MKPEIREVLNDIIDDNIGIYPQSTNDKSRTEWQDGWNACAMRFSELNTMITTWHDNLDESIRILLDPLLIAEHVSAELNGDEIQLTYNTSDIFAWGYSDFAILEYSELKVFTACMANRKYGISRYTCLKAGEKPQYPIIWDMHEAGEWDDIMEGLSDNSYNVHVGWDQTPTKNWRS